MRGTIEYRCKELFESHINAYIAVTDSQFEYIADRFALEEIKPRVLIQAPGGLCKYEYFVAKGLLQHSYTDESGKEFTLSFPRENWWAGDFKSFKNEKVTDKSLRALEHTWVLKITRDDFLDLMRNSVVFERYIAALSENNSLRMQERVLSDMSSSLEKKVKDFYLNSPDLVARLSQKRIASYLGVSAEHLSKVLNSRKDWLTIDPS